jgi:hypothetical protein
VKVGWTLNFSNDLTRRLTRLERNTVPSSLTVVFHNAFFFRDAGSQTVFTIHSKFLVFNAPLLCKYGMYLLHQSIIQDSVDLELSCSYRCLGISRNTMAPLSGNRKNLLLIAILQVATNVASDTVGCTGFYCPGRINSQNDDNDEPCTGFGCDEGNSREEDSQFFDDTVDCTKVSLDMTTDGRPEDTTFELICNGAHIWQYPSESIPMRGQHDQLSVSACVVLVDDTCCEFVIKDSAKDGLTDGDYATLALKIDGEDVLTYNTLDSPPFESLTRTFGSACKASGMPDETPQSCAEGDTLARFEIALDDKPEETSWYLMCDDATSDTLTTLWNKPRGTLTVPKEAIVENACISSSSTCSFSIEDSAGDGLELGDYSLTFGDTVIDVYDNKPFVAKNFCIGHLCAPTIQKAAEDAIGSIEDFDDELNDDLVTDSSRYGDTAGTADSPIRDPDFVEGPPSGISLESWTHALIGVASLMGLLVVTVACTMVTGTKANQASAASNAAQGALAVGKGSDSDDAATFLGEDDEPHV